MNSIIAISSFYHIFYILVCLVYLTHSSGIFEVEIIDYEHKKLYTNSDQQIIYNVCLKESNTFNHDLPCTYGNVSSPPINPSNGVTLKLPFTFRWMVSNHSNTIN